MASLVLANSEETKHILMGALMDRGRIEVFDNPAPSAFLCEEPPNSELQAVLVVSNHPPREVLQAVRALRRRGISVTTVGQHFDNEIPVTPNLLRTHDAVVTIGKTFQYALLARRPVFLYDHFGGPGYLLDDGMFELARTRNFSGRGFDGRLRPTDIEERLVSDYRTAVGATDTYRNGHLRRFLLEERLERVLRGLSRAKVVGPFPTAVELAAASATHDIIVEQEKKLDRLEDEVSHPWRQLVRTGRTTRSPSTPTAGAFMAQSPQPSMTSSGIVGPPPSSEPTTVSIVVATYNGERWLPEQLESLLQQTRQPNQVVITDDGSTDSTPDFIDGFADRVPFQVRVLRRESPVGYTENFVQALSACDGDIVFFCDQDDVWFPEKVSTVLEAFGATGAALVVHDQQVVDDQLRPQPVSMLQRFRRDGLPTSHHRKGCATAARASFLRAVTPVGPGFAFDTWFHDVAAAVGQRRVLARVLMAYRVHDDNTSTFRLNRLDPPEQRNAFVSGLSKRCLRLGWFFAPVAALEQQTQEDRAVIDTARAYVQTVDPASSVMPEPLQQLEAEVRRLDQRVHHRTSSAVWQRLYELLAPLRR